MFGRSKEWTKSSGLRPRGNSRSEMSARVAASAVAVSATVCTSPSASRARARSRYSGRKSWPHCETQCASSTASRRTPAPCNASINPSIRSRSGETKSRRKLPWRMPRQVSRALDSDTDELRVPAETPKASICFTWSCISAIRGETTTVSDSSTRAGSW